MVHREVEVVAANRYILARECRIDGLKAFSAAVDLCASGITLTARHFFTERASEEEGAWHSRHLQQVAKRILVLPRKCEKLVRSLHEPFDSPVSAIFLQSSYTASSKHRFP